MKKTYVLDTNVLLSDPNSLFSFEDNDLIVPMVVLEELDKQKSRQDEVGRHARQVSRSLDELRTEGSLVNGVSLRSGGTLRIAQIDAMHIGSLPFELQSTKVDNMIIAFMLCTRAAILAKSTAEDADAMQPILVSKDINVRIKCDSLGIKCEDYLKMRVATDPRKFYRGVEVIEVSDSLVESFYAGEAIEFPRSTTDSPALFKGFKLYANEIVVLKGPPSEQTQKSAIAKCKVSDNGQLMRIVPIKKIDKAFGLSPRNKEQTFSLDLLFDEDIKLLTLVGPSGTGKTILALAAALEQLKVYGAVPRYEKVIVTRPVQPLGNDLGFLPGTLKEKMEPWISPIRDNMEFLMRTTQKGSAPKTRNRDETFLDLLQHRGLVEIEAITFIRGRSIPNTFIVIDEAQNLSMHELKTIVTRAGDNTKIVLTGDIEQIDNVHVDAFTNGLTYAVERFKEYGLAGHVTLIKGERSQLATLASKIL
jgi:PhoH-like ATPase